VPLLIDEKKGRKVAQQIGIETIGFLGILLLNYKRQFLSKTEILEILDESEKNNYRIGEVLKQELIHKLI